MAKADRGVELEDGTRKKTRANMDKKTRERTNLPGRGPSKSGFNEMTYKKPRMKPDKASQKEIREMDDGNPTAAIIEQILGLDRQKYNQGQMAKAMRGDIPRPMGPNDEDPYNESPNMPPLGTEDDPHGYYDGGGGEGPSVMYQGTPSTQEELLALIEAQLGPYKGPMDPKAIEGMAQVAKGRPGPIYRDRQYSKEYAADPVGNGPDPMLAEFMKAMTSGR